MRANGVAVRFVAQTLQEMHGRGLWWQGEALAPGHMELLAAGVAVRSLGNRNNRNVADAEIIHHLGDRAELALAAINQQQVRPAVTGAVGILLQRAFKAAVDHLAHHCEIIPLGDSMRALIADVEFAVGGLVEALRPGDNHAANSMPPLDVRIVINLDPVRHAIQPEQLGKLGQEAAL